MENNRRAPLYILALYSATLFFNIHLGIVLMSTTVTVEALNKVDAATSSILPGPDWKLVLCFSFESCVAYIVEH